MDWTIIPTSLSSQVLYVYKPLPFLCKFEVALQNYIKLEKEGDPKKFFESPVQSISEFLLRLNLSLLHLLQRINVILAHVIVALWIVDCVMQTTTLLALHSKLDYQIGCVDDVSQLTNFLRNY